MSAKILIIDDLKDWRTTLKSILCENGFSVFDVGNTSDARNILETEKFDLALLDIRLDENDENDHEGLDFAEEINESWPKIKIIFLTGYANEAFIQRAMMPKPRGRGRLAVDFIKKSDMDDLVDTINKVLT